MNDNLNNQIKNQIDNKKSIEDPNWTKLVTDSKTFLQKANKAELKLARGSKDNYKLMADQSRLREYIAHLTNEAEKKNSSNFKYSFEELSENIDNIVQISRKNQMQQEIYTYVFDYEKTINEFLKRTIYLTYVGQDGQVYILDEKSAGDVYKGTTGLQKERARTRVLSKEIKEANTLEKKLEKGMGDLQEKFKTIKYRQERYKEMYKEALSRNKIWNFEGHDPKEIKGIKSGSEKYFRFGMGPIEQWETKWGAKGTNTSKAQASYAEWGRAKNGALIYVFLGGNGGDFSEGYIQLLVDEKKLFSSDQEKQINEFWDKYVQGIKNNKKAIIEGDISPKEGILGEKNIQFAVKGGQSGFSLPGYKQYLRFAINIVNLNNQQNSNPIKHEFFTEEIIDKMASECGQKTVKFVQGELNNFLKN